MRFTHVGKNTVWSTIVYTDDDYEDDPSTAMSQRDSGVEHTPESAVSYYRILLGTSPVATKWCASLFISRSTSTLDVFGP